MINDVVIAGYYGFDNAGDELILLSLVKGFKDINSNIKITVLSARPEKTAMRFGVKSVSRWNPFAVVRVMLKTDTFLFGGGGLFQDITSAASIVYYLGLIILARLFYKKVVLLSQGIGPIDKGINRKLARFIIMKTSLITVRDKESETRLEEIGIIHPRIKIGADMAFGLNPPVKHKARNSFTVGISLREWGKGAKIEEGIQRICRELISKYKAEIIFIPFHPCKDAGICRRTAESVKGSKLFVWEDLEDIFDIYNRIDAVVGMRLHSLILACLFKKPFVAISKLPSRAAYDPKINIFLSSLGVESSVLYEKDLFSGDCAERVFNILKNREEFIQGVGAKVTEFVVMARNNLNFIKEL